MAKVFKSKNDFLAYCTQCKQDLSYLDGNTIYRYLHLGLAVIVPSDSFNTNRVIEQSRAFSQNYLKLVKPQLRVI